MKLSSKARYGMYAMVELAKSSEKTMSASELATKTGVTEKYLEQILAILKKNDLITSTRGATGGYSLSHSSSDITAGQILRALEDNLELVECIHKGCATNGNCNCVSRNLWTKLYKHINEYLDNVSLEQLAEDNL